MIQTGCHKDGCQRETVAQRYSILIVCREKNTLGGQRYLFSIDYRPFNFRTEVLYPTQPCFLACIYFKSHK